MTKKKKETVNNQNYQGVSGGKKAAKSRSSHVAKSRRRKIKWKRNRNVSKATNERKRKRETGKKNYRVQTGAVAQSRVYEFIGGINANLVKEIIRGRRIKRK